MPPRLETQHAPTLTTAHLAPHPGVTVSSVRSLRFLSLPPPRPQLGFQPHCVSLVPATHSPPITLLCQVSVRFLSLHPVGFFLLCHRASDSDSDDPYIVSSWAGQGLVCVIHYSVFSSPDLGFRVWASVSRTRVSIQAASLLSCENRAKFLHLFKPHFSHFSNGDDAGPFLTELL